jgi:hypothetical protein
MNPSQVEAVKDDWTARLNQKDPNIDRVRCFFNPDFAGCKTLSRELE